MYPVQSRAASLAQFAALMSVVPMSSASTGAGTSPASWNPELPLESWRVSYAASGWTTAIFSYSVGDINAAELCRRRVL